MIAVVSSWLQLKFKEADKSMDGRLNFEEAIQLLRAMNIQVRKDQALWLFNVI